MRITPFKTVLWAVAYKLGLDPTQSNFLTNQAESIGTFIDEWVDRTYSKRDFPEWTLTQQFQPDTSHIVPWDAISVDTGLRSPMFRILKVYLVDPLTNNAPIDAHFTLKDSGVHCGFDHGSSVWIKYIADRPKFTAVQWDASVRYKTNDIVYSYSSGQCYKSKVAGNIGHDPSFTFSPVPGFNIVQEPIDLGTELTVPLVADQPGTAVQTEKIVLTCALLNGTTDLPPNPPPNLSQLYISVMDATGTNQLGSANSFGDGILTLDELLEDMKNQLISDLGAGWTITVDANALTLTIENASGFGVNNWFYVPLGGPTYNLLKQQTQTYIPATSAVTGTRQQIVFTLTEDNITPDAEYTLTFKDVSGVNHEVSYIAKGGDGSIQVQSGLISAVHNAALSDPFFNDVTSALDMTSLQTTFGSSTQISIGATMGLPGSAWWELVPFPSVIVNQVIRGAYADLLKEWGQVEKGASEEQVVPQEQQVAVTDFDTTPNPPLTGQQKPLSRYKVS